MNERNPYQRWLNNPERRVGRLQLLRTTAAAVGPGNSHYVEHPQKPTVERGSADRKVPGQ